MKKFLSAVKLMLTLECEESTHLVSESLDRDLSFAERWAVRLHAIGCWSCRRFGKQIRLIQKLMRGHSERVTDDVKLPPEAVDRIRKAIDAE